MRHRKLRRKLGVKSQHRKSLLRNLVRELVTHKRIRTTHAKAKEASAFADKMVSLALRGGIHARRQLVSKLGCDDTARKLMVEWAPLFKNRPGGYTRVMRLERRPGDASEMAFLEFTELPAVVEKPKKKATKKSSKASGATATEKKTSAKDTKSKAKTQEQDATDEQKSEAEKKGGFLGTLRKFLKGSE